MEVQRKIQEDTNLYFRMKEGDRDAFDSLFIRYYPILNAYAQQFVLNEDAEEIVQDIMLWLWESKERQVIETSLGQYLFKAVKNRCLTLINRNLIRQKINNILHQEMQHIFDDPDFYIVEELSKKIENAIQALPESYRFAFEQNRFNNKTYQEIAAELGVSVKTIDYRIQQALKILRVELKDFLPILLIFLSYSPNDNFFFDPFDTGKSSNKTEYKQLH